MGKWTDKLYITHSEWTNDFGGAKTKQQKYLEQDALVEGFRRLPFNYCALSLLPFGEHPVCSPSGNVYDKELLLKYIGKHGKDPVTKESLKKEQLIPLHFHKNSEGQYHCPISQKIFNDSSHIVAIRPSGNVFSYEVIEKLNIETKNMKDLLTDEPFVKKDLITIQDPKNVNARDINQFKHLSPGSKGSVALTSWKEEVDTQKPLKRSSATADINLPSTAVKILKELEKNKKPTPSYFTPVSTALPSNAPNASSSGYTANSASIPANVAHFSKGKVAASLMSTSMPIVTRNELAILDPIEYMLEQVKDPAFLSLTTNLGKLNLELYVKKAPRTCFNFLMLCKTKYYNNTIFHRNIPGFMIQGGDPTGKGTGGQSIFKKDFADEVGTDLVHECRGLLSMANHGKNTNGSQFFITYAACPHLNGKHTLFGKVVGGLPILDAMERVPCSKGDRPISPIQIIGTDVFVDPFEKFMKAQNLRNPYQT